jgi:hypothetical protein
LIRIRARGWFRVALLLVVGTGAAEAQSSPLAITVGGAAAEWRPFVRVDGLLLQDRALRDALDSGLPLRFRFRLELWERAVFDRLVGAEEVTLALVQEPLEGTYTVSSDNSNRTYGGLADAERAIGGALPNTLRPRARGGRFYYLATLEIETLSLSDLAELQRWLRGEARPAVQGRRPVGRALGRGLQRAFVRMVGLPTRRYETRTPTFTAG